MHCPIVIVEHLLSSPPPRSALAAPLRFEHFRVRPWMKIVRMNLILCILITLLFQYTIYGLNIGFFCNWGFYTHDLYSNFLAESMASDGHNVTILQVKILSFRKMQFRQRYIMYDFTNNSRAEKVKKNWLRLIWHTTLPIDLQNATGSLMSLRAFGALHDHAYNGCEASLDDKEFVGKIRSLKLDLIIVDHTVDCASAIANTLNVPFAHVACTPTFFEPLAFPSIPSYVPLYFSNFEPYEDFESRTLNALGYALMLALRIPFSNQHYVDLFYKKLKVNISSAGSFFWRPVMFASSWEMLLDMPRPTARHARYFGCEWCLEQEQQRRQEKFNFTERPGGVVVVTFGTVNDPKEIPVEKLQNFMKAFSFFHHHTFLWQLDLPADYVEETVLRPLNMTMPQQVTLHRWLPMKELLANPKVVLLVMHGGATISLEVAFSAVPVLVTSIMCEHLYIGHRLAHRGYGEDFLPTEADADTVALTMDHIFRNYAKYKTRAVKFAEMLIEYRNFESPSSKFWIAFVARQFGGPANRSRAKVEKYWTLRQPTSWIIYHCSDILPFVLMATVCTVVLLCR